MDNKQALLNLQADMERHMEEWSTLGWQITPWPLTSPTFVVYLPALDGERYAFRVTADNYPLAAPHVIPIDPETGRSDVRTAWPRCDGFRFEASDLCLPYTRTGYSLHPDWVRHSLWKWDERESTVRVTLESLFNRLNDSNRYQGRCRP